jgi:hypothetical protein
VTKGSSGKGSTAIAATIKQTKRANKKFNFESLVGDEAGAKTRKEIS